MSRLSPPEEQPVGAPAWVLPYGDMMTLLLACFVLVASMSEIKEDKKFQATAEALRGRFGCDLSLGGLVAGSGGARKSALDHLLSAGRARRAEALSGGDKVRAPLGETLPVAALHVSRPAAIGVIFFDERGSTLTEEGRTMLAAAAQEIGGKSRQIEIRGHASARPPSPHSTWKTPWDLAYARCGAAMQYLVKLGIKPQQIRLAVVPQGQTRHTGQDRRLPRDNPPVEVLILQEQLEDLEGLSREERPEWLVVQRPPIDPEVSNATALGVFSREIGLPLVALVAFLF